jgi:ribosome biogenesis GTPase / thiamine phosphate phosphatase
MTADNGVVIRRTKGFYYVRADKDEEIECKIKGQLFKDSQYDNQVAVGDKVEFIREHAGDIGLIKALQDRKSFLSRNRVGKEAEQVIAANIDHMLIVSAAKNPPFRTNLVNRMLVAANAGNIKPILVISKTDLVENSFLNEISDPYQEVGLEIIPFTNTQPNKNEALLDVLIGHVSVLVGQSGVGKSTILNTLFPSLDLKVGKIGVKTRKGLHTTTYAMMHRIAENSYVIDTPGIREFGLWNVTQDNLDEYYPGFADQRNKCKHRDCNHVHEPECAIKEAVKSKTIHRLLYDGYVSIFETLSGYHQNKIVYPNGHRT